MINTSLLRERLLAKDVHELQNPVILDEVQKVPDILDEVHWLIENEGLRFLLCGSSARKLKRGKANLLGGRARRYEMFPLVSAEVHELDLLNILNRGMIPAHLFDKQYESLSGHILNYEIHYWKTKTGLEVDFILGNGEVAVEVKGKNRVDQSDLRALNAFVETYAPTKAVLVCNEKKEPRVHGAIRIMPWQAFLSALWKGEIIG